MRASATLWALLAIALAVGLSACGGGGESSTSTSTPQGPSASAAGAGAKAKPAGAAAVPAAAAARAGRGSAAAPSAGTGAGAQQHKKGAAGFVVAGGDNSIPNYGSESSSQQQGEASQVLSEYLSARAAANWASACSYLGAPVRSQVEILAAASGGEKSKSCPDSLAKLAESGPQEERESPFSGKLAAFRIKGEHAFALFYGPHQQQFMMPMVSEGGGWRMGMFAPVPYPPGAPGGG